MRFRRRGFETRIESNCDVVGEGEVPMIVRFRTVRAVVNRGVPTVKFQLPLRGGDTVVWGSDSERRS